MKLISGVIIFLLAAITGIFLPAKLPPQVEIKPTLPMASIFYPPLSHAKDRVTKKTFGMYITPQNSPVRPEKFTGYHTGTDFEVEPNEINLPVEVKTVCPGKLLVKEYATGYGGVAVQACTLNNQPITVIYGHLKLGSINWNKGDFIEGNKILGLLGADKSPETDGERKHLHLGIHLGTEINIRGYVNTQNQLKDWTDPLPMF